MAELGNRLEGVPVVYLALLIFVLISAAAATAIVVDKISGGAYPSGYFVETTLFDAVGVDSSSAIFATAGLFSSNFYLLLPLLIADGVIKIAVIGFVIAGVIELMANLNIRARLVSIRVRGMKGGTLVCGYNALADELCAMLAKHSVPFVVVEKDNTISEMVIERGYNVVSGDFTDEATLKEAAIGKAKAAVFSTESDFENLLGIVAAHHLNDRVKIVSRAKDESSVSKMHRAGAALCVVPEVLTGLEIGGRIAKEVV
jgi:voltage-gated potassium channel Kch